jgi:cytochrome P450
MSSWIAQYEIQDELNTTNAPSQIAAEALGKDVPVLVDADLPEPPGPRGLARIYTQLRMIWDPLGTATRLFRRYGDVVRLNREVCLVANPELVETVVRDYYSFGKNFSQTYRDAAATFWGNSMLVSNDAAWLRQRRILQRALHHSRIAAYGATMVSYTSRMLDTWGDGESFDLHQRLMQLTLAVMTRNLLGTDLPPDEAREVVAALDATLALFSDLSQLELTFDTAEKRRFRETVERLNAIVYAAIARRRTDFKDCGDILSALMTTPDEAGRCMTDTELRDEIVTMLRAAHRNTATLLAWAFALLSRHPEVDATLTRELTDVLDGKTPDLSALPRLSCTENIVKETMRYYPLYPIVRRDIAHSYALGGYRIAPGTALGISVWAMHRDPRYFENPERFTPDRWTDELERSLPKLAFLPFGGGPRQCPFKSYAMFEAVLLLATIAQRYQIELAPGERAVPHDAANGLMPKNGLRVIVKRRASSVPHAHP